MGLKETESLDPSEKRPLVVDLDGTLICTDLLVESTLALLKRNILFAFLLPFWLLKGKACLKNEIANRVDVEASLLPYHDEFLAFLRAEHASGRRLILATASNEKYASAIADYLNIFHVVLASDPIVNLAGYRKLERVQDLFGKSGFDYAANAMVDITLWERAYSAILVNPERKVKAKLERQREIALIFDNRTGNPLLRYFKALRLHQWVKNLLVFIPLLMAHQFDDPLLAGRALLAFLVFGLCASSVYVLNDLLDLPDDRQHLTKKHRPFAAGSISVINGVLMIPGLLFFALALALMLPLQFLGVLALYYLITLVYSFRLKRAALVDVLILAGLYTIRIIAGAAAVSIVPSFWLLTFSMFLFLSLALVKRFTELQTLRGQDRTKTSGRGYSTADLDTLSQFGSSSANMAVLVLALYINSEAVQVLYRRPEVIWLLCPLLLYLVTRIWLLARRGQLHEDPVVFVIRDRRSQWLGVAGAVLLWLAV